MINTETAGKFIKCVEAQKALYLKLKPVVAEENKLLSERKVKNLESLIKKQEDMIISIKNLEEEKMELFKELALQAGFKKEEPVKLQDVIEKAGESLKKAGEAVENLMAVVREVDGLNAGNAHLIKEYLGVMDFTAKLKEKMNNKTATTYTDSGIINEKKAEHQKSKFDTKI